MTFSTICKAQAPKLTRSLLPSLRNSPSLMGRNITHNIKKQKEQFEHNDAVLCGGWIGGSLGALFGLSMFLDYYDEPKSSFTSGLINLFVFETGAVTVGVVSGSLAGSLAYRHPVVIPIGFTSILFWRISRRIRNDYIEHDKFKK